ALKKKRFYRLLFETSLRFLGRKGSVRQLQWNSPSNPEVYQKWAKQYKVSPVVEEVPQTGKRVVWIGNKNAEKVVFYVHVPNFTESIPGGGFMLPISDFMLTFWLFVQPIYPQTFPTQLKEIVHAFSHVLSTSHAKPSNIHLAGDSAGANLVLQFLSHTLHPVPSPDVPKSPLVQPVRGVLLVSPWLSLNEQTSTHIRNDASDCLTSATLINWGSHYLEGVKDSQLPYIKVLAAGDRWFDGIGKLTDRVLITAGDAECLLEDSIRIHSRFKDLVAEGRPELELDVEAGGVHEDMMMELGAGGKKLTAAGERIVAWLQAGNGDDA
ncbi:hypothetical protein V5O48_017576, partial [Marasmius crinis-equi]